MKTLNEKLNNCGKDYKKIDTALIILVEQKLLSCFDMFIQTRNRALELSQSTRKPSFDAFCKGLINEKERLIVSKQLSPNKSLIAYNPNNSFHNAKGSCSHTSKPTNNSNVHHESSKKKKVYDPCKHRGKTNHLEKNCFKLKRLMSKAKKKGSDESHVALCASVVSSSISSSNVE